MTLNDAQITERAAKLGYDFLTEKQGRVTLYVPVRRADGKRLSPCTKLGAAMRIVDVDVLRRHAQ
jgi:hypothetical protein